MKPNLPPSTRKAKNDRTEPMEPNTPPPKENLSEPNLWNLTSPPPPQKNLSKPNLWNLTRTYGT